MILLLVLLEVTKLPLETVLRTKPCQWPIFERPQTNSLTCNLTSISFLIRPRLGLVISGVTRFCPLRLPARLPAYTRLGHCYSTRPPHQHHPRVPWPFAFTSTVMSSSDDDQPLGKGTSRAWFHFICLGDAAVQSVGLLFD